ncbi:hypothetical protein PIB30_101669 [Stylosanthes scabra]|uniref:F-box associated domain-containing protein n=1 Tax=Stylosanthes scabra TaxID=79078 RepID=A0ABU6ZW78_9FABA|nr:hypothetical protein [Stylosanthes scabra]
MDTPPKRNKNMTTHKHTPSSTRTNTNTNLPFLGEDALFNIFVRCEPRTVGRVRCTSNTWRWRLRGPDFARQNWIANEHHSSTALLGHGYSSYSEKCHWATQVNAGDGSVNIVRLPFEIREARYFTIVGSDNGNICVTYSETGEDRELLVLNPLTKKYVHLQYWRARGVYVTEIEKVGPTSVVVNGVVFWIGWGGFFNLKPTHLLAFSLEKEIFFQEPILKDNTSTYNSIIKINNELGFVSYNDIGLKRKLDVWNIHFTEEDNFEWQKLYHIEDFGIPYTPSFINEQEMISLLDTRTTPNGSNDDLRTEVVMSKMNGIGGNREVIYFQGWQMSVFIKSITCHRDGLFEFSD